MSRDENQNAEYKESRPDKHLEWICGLTIATPRRRSPLRRRSRLRNWINMR